MWFGDGWRCGWDELAWADAMHAARHPSRQKRAPVVETVATSKRAMLRICCRNAGGALLKAKARASDAFTPLNAPRICAGSHTSDPAAIVRLRITGIAPSVAGSDTVPVDGASAGMAVASALEKHVALDARTHAVEFHLARLSMQTAHFRT